MTSYRLPTDHEANGGTERPTMVDFFFHPADRSSGIRVSRMTCGKFIATASVAGAAVLALVASLTEFAHAQVNCEMIAAGPARTDCYIGLSLINRQKSEIAASTAQQRADSAIYHQSTGRRPKPKAHRPLPDR